MLFKSAVLFGIAVTVIAPLPSIWAKSEPAFDSNPAQDSAPHQFVLSPRCPPGFSLETNKQCKLRTLYQFYSSVQNKGVGGTRTSLPKYRDGFTPQQIDLGRLLFFDPLLSGDKTRSCASCHQPDNGFSDGLARSIGAKNAIGARSTPSLWNSAFLTRFNWDASADSLEQQVKGPLFSTHEMSNTPKQLRQRLSANQIYPRLFQQAFNNGLTLENTYTALAAFQSSLISLNSRYDEYAHGNHQALTDDEIAGMNVFRSFVARCSECHTPPLFTNNQIAVIGVPEPHGRPFDRGAEITFKARKLRGGFKVPTLRNIVKTAPYMHQGNFDHLRDAIEFYNKGRGHAAPKDTPLFIHWHISEPDLSDKEIDLIVTFMGALSDEKFMPKRPSQVPSGLPVKSTVANAQQPKKPLQKSPTKVALQDNPPAAGER